MTPYNIYHVLRGINAGGAAVSQPPAIPRYPQVDLSTLWPVVMRVFQARTMLSLFTTLNTNVRYIAPIFTRTTTQVTTIGVVLLLAYVKDNPQLLDQNKKYLNYFDNRTVGVIKQFAAKLDSNIRYMTVVGAVAQIALGSPVFGAVTLGIVLYDIAQRNNAFSLGAYPPIGQELMKAMLVADLVFAVTT